MLAALARAGRRRGFSTVADSSAEGDRLLPYALGLLSALPFLALTPQGVAACAAAAEQHLGQQLPLSQPAAARLQVLYGASVLAFLGGPHWGVALATSATGAAAAAPMANVARYAWGVTPSMLAVPLPLLPLPAAQGALLLGLGTALAADAAFASRRLLPRWYFYHLRVPLTAVAASSVLLSALAGQAGLAEGAQAARPSPPARQR